MARFNLILLALLTTTIAAAETNRAANAPPANKLLYMHKLFYLPFSIDFQQGQKDSDVLPFVDDKFGHPERLMTPEELKTLESEWENIRKPWEKKSLFLTTSVPLNSTVRITDHLMSHRVSVDRTTLDQFSITDRAQLSALIAKSQPEVQAEFRQLLFLKSLVPPLEAERFNFFIVSASWCASCHEYQLLLESYAKAFPDPNLILHTLVVDDPKEQIFDSPILKDLFPVSAKAQPLTIPRFLAFQTVNGKARILQEGEALAELYRKYFEKHQGYLNSKSTLFKNVNPPSERVDPTLSWNRK